MNNFFTSSFTLSPPIFVVLPAPFEYVLFEVQRAAADRTTVDRFQKLNAGNNQWRSDEPNLLAKENRRWMWVHV